MTTPARYIYQHPDWPQMQWDSERIGELLAQVRFAQGSLLGQLRGMGMRFRKEAELATLTTEVMQSSAIEGEKLDIRQVQSSVARRLGLPDMALRPSEQRVEGVVEMTMDATTNFATPLTAERLFSWHTLLFPKGWSDVYRIKVGAWRDEEMEVVSYTQMGFKTVHFEAPPPAAMEREMDAFLAWFNAGDAGDWVLRSAQAHLWFVTVHPFEDGNGRIARAIAEMSLARSDQSPQRCYSMSSQIKQEQKAYYAALQRIQGESTDITSWMEWYLGCLHRALAESAHGIDRVIRKAEVFAHIGQHDLNERQRKVTNRILDGFAVHLTAEKWAKLAKCSHNTALRDIDDLIAKGILAKSAAGGRSTHYTLVGLPEDAGPFVSPEDETD